MKTNLPITQNEVVVKPGQVIVSKTDTKGVITYVNRTFIEISGFTENELIGKSHNIVRHPDMPQAAFADLWSTLKRGHPWTGVVKNRCKNGDFYWVQANVTPIYSDGSVVGYMSVRHPVSREQVREAEQVYQSLKDNRVALDEGMPVAAKNKFGLVSFPQGSLPRFKQLNTVLMTLAMAAALASIFWEDKSNGINLLLLGSILLSAVAFAVQVFCLKRVGDAMRLAESAVIAMAEGNFEQPIVPYATPITANLSRKLKSLQIKTGFELSNTKKIAEDATRIKQALDACNTSVMLVDNNQTIIYLNASASSMLLAAEADIRTELNEFCVAQLPGKTLDILGAQGVQLSRCTASSNNSTLHVLKLGGRTFNIHVTPVYLDDQSRFGAVLEWMDTTEALLAAQIEQEKMQKEAQVSRLNAQIKQALDHVSTCVMVTDKNRNIVYQNNAFGALTKTLNKYQNATDLAFFFEHPGIRQMIETQSVESLRTNISESSHHVEITVNTVKDETGQCMAFVSEWIDKTDEIHTLGEIDEIVAGAGKGCLSSRINELDKTGFFLSVSKGLNQLLDLCEGLILEMDVCLAAIAKGNLTLLITGDYQGDFAHLKNNTNHTIAQLTQIIDQIRAASSCILQGTNEIALGNTHLSQRTEEQASALEETASSMEQMTSAVTSTSENLHRVWGLSDEAREKAQRGGDIVSLAVDAMDKIRVSSKKIEDIIGVIDEIAFQTNLLALNAAVEAARAGDAGRGFAVVASEVRALSQRSASAAKEIKQLINESVVHVEKGADYVTKSGMTLGEIVAAVNAVNTLATSVAAAAKEQTQGIQQVNRAVAEMDSVTQQNAALVEQASAASMAVSEQAKQLESMIGFFRLIPAATPNKAMPPKAFSTAPTKVKSVATATPPPQTSAAEDMDSWEIF